MRDSSEEEILWLETMLNRALHISTESSAEWRPLLVEKIKQFQKSHHLKTDGVVGFSTLVHLWQVAGRVPTYIGMKQIFPQKQQ